MNTKTPQRIPGPWRAEPLMGRGACIKGASGEWTKLSCGNNAATDEANARLIAAAPELLDLLGKACASVENQANWDKHPYSDWYYAAKAAIAKATGETT